MGIVMVYKPTYNWGGGPILYCISPYFEDYFSPFIDDVPIISH